LNLFRKKLPKITQKMHNEFRSSFPNEAYRPYNKPGCSKPLTTLDPMYIVERLNNVLGLGRWSLLHEIVPHQIKGTACVKGRIVLLDYSCELPITYGSNTNQDIGDAHKGAVTDLLSKSASYLEIGIDMFKGKIEPPKPAYLQNQQRSQNG
jgi:hypothetical protein